MFFSMAQHLSRVIQRGDSTHKIHGTGRFTYICHKNQLNVGKYTYHTWMVWARNPLTEPENSNGT